MTDAMKRALKWFHEHGGTGVLDRRGRMLAAGEIATQFLGETWLRLVADGAIVASGGRFEVSLKGTDRG